MSEKGRLLAIYQEMASLPDTAPRAQKQRRGYGFEKWLRALLDHEGLEPRSSYIPTGEQIDGSFLCDGTYFLIEAKWVSKGIPASELYRFKGKVDGKLVGTLGVFISMSGYSESAVDALSVGKGLSVILFDRSDMETSLRPGHSFKAVLKYKLRKAAEEGIVYFPTSAGLVEGPTCLVESLLVDRATGIPAAPSTGLLSDKDVIIVCEGDRDRAALGVLAGRILERAQKSRRVAVLTAMGKYAVAQVANAVHESNPTSALFLLVVDADEDASATRKSIEKRLDFSSWQMSIPEPTLEAWLGIEIERKGTSSPKARLQKYEEAAREVDLEQLAEQSEAFRVFSEAVVGSKGPLKRHLPDS